MSDLETILDAWRATERDGGDGVLATIVHVSGFTYCRPGARMLLLADGRRFGTVSVGCLESELCRRAWWDTESARPVVRVYDSRSGDDAVWEFGLGCNGVVHVIIERVQAPATAEVLAFLDETRRARETAVVATLIATPPGVAAQVGERLLVDPRGVWGGALRHRGLAADVLHHARRALSGQGSHLAHVAGHAIFVERVIPPLDHDVLGGGDGVKPLVTMATVPGAVAAQHGTTVGGHAA